MDFIEKLQALSAKIQKQQSLIQTEEATKNAFVLPFLSALGYEVFDPTEVVPEFGADADLRGLKKGEKVDYAVMRDGKVLMLFECKAAHVDLAEEHASQLYRYFSVTEAHVAVLTDGIVYRFYTDVEKAGKLDTNPFMVFDMLNMQDHLVPELKRLTKPAFKLDEIMAVAKELKYGCEIKRIIAEQSIAPSDDFVSFFARRVYSRTLTQSVREMFTTITKKAFAEFINETINERLRSAMSPQNGSTLTSSEGATPPGGEEEGPERIVTTSEELEGFYIVKAVLRTTVDPARITHRDTRSYFGILLDDTNRKPICRLHFDRSQKFLGLFGQDREWEKVPIEKLDDLYGFADRLKATVTMHESPPSPATQVE